MIIMEIFSSQNSDPLWGVAMLFLFPFIIVEIFFLALAGITLRASTVKAGKGWILGVLFFALGVVLECGFSNLMRLLFPYKGTISFNWLLDILLALILVGLFSFGMFHLFEWIDCVLYDHYKKSETKNLFQSKVSQKMIFHPSRLNEPIY
jgi:high-affinity Fe2+/Pb2+ permease